MKFIRSNAYAAFLGVSLTAVGIDFLGWQFYAIAIPTVLLVGWKANHER